MLPKQARGTFRKHITKPLEQVATPPTTLDSMMPPAERGIGGESGGSSGMGGQEITDGYDE